MKKGQAHAVQYRGVRKFVEALKKCKNSDEERHLIDEELAKIRNCFSKTHVKHYNKKKYMWKIMYMYMLGYDVDFGHMQCVDLINQNLYSAKNVGYIGVSLLLIEHNDLLRLCIQSIKNDLDSKDEIFQSLALTCVANVGGNEFAESLAGAVTRMLTSKQSRNFVMKKAALCLLRLIRQSPECCPPRKEAVNILDILEHRNVGVVQCVVSLLLGLATYDPDPYKAGVPKAIKLLHQFVMDRECSKEYLYYRTSCPWLQVKLLRFLQYYPPVESSSQRDNLREILDTILTKTEVTQSVNKNNADHSILFEAVNVVIHYNIQGASRISGLHKKTTELLAKFISVKEPNIRYLGLEMMSRLAKVPNTHSMIKQHLKTIQYSLDDLDISIRKRALDLLYSIADGENIKEIVDHFLKYLESAHYEIREELVLKIAILAEKFASDLKWYVTVVLELVAIADKYISDDVWHRIIQIVTNNEDLQAFAAHESYIKLTKPPVSETMVKVAGYLLGEFGHNTEVSGVEQFRALHKNFPSVSHGAQAQLLSTYMKLSFLYDELQSKVLPVFMSFHGHIDQEIQQRAVEYKVMTKWEDQEFMSGVWEAMPDFPEFESELLKNIRKKEAVTWDKNVFAKEMTDDRKIRNEDTSEGKSNDDSSDSSSSDSDSSDTKDDDEGEEVANNTLGRPPTYTEAKAATESQFDDLLDFGKVAAQTNNTQDIFGATSAADDIFGTSTAKKSRTAKNPNLIIRLLVTDDGLLYDDEMVTINVKTKCERTSGILKLKLFYENKTKMAISDVKLDVVTTQGLQIDLQPSDSFNIYGEQQVQQFVKVSCLKPFDALPKISIQGVHGSPFTIDLELPVVFTKFMSPFNLDAKDFTTKWKQMKAESQAVIIFKRALPSATLKRVMGSGMGLTILEGVDPKAENIVAVGVFYTSSNVNMPAMIRLEWAKDRFRLTAKSPHDAVSGALVESFTRIFGVKK